MVFYSLVITLAVLAYAVWNPLREKKSQQHLIFIFESI